MDITEIFTLLIKLAVTLLIMCVVPGIKASLDLKDALAWVDIAVRAAEQLYRQGDGNAKKAYVLAFLEGHNIFLDEEEVETAIEAAVLRLHKELA